MSKFGYWCRFCLPDFTIVPDKVKRFLFLRDFLRFEFGNAVFKDVMARSFPEFLYNTFSVRRLRASSRVSKAHHQPCAVLRVDLVAAHAPIRPEPFHAVQLPGYEGYGGVGTGSKVAPSRVCRRFRSGLPGGLKAHSRPSRGGNTA